MNAYHMARARNSTVQSRLDRLLIGADQRTKAQVFSVSAQGVTKVVMASTKSEAVKQMQGHLVDSGVITRTHDIRMTAKVTPFAPIVGATIKLDTEN